MILFLWFAEGGGLLRIWWIVYCVFNYYYYYLFKWLIMMISNHILSIINLVMIAFNVGLPFRVCWKIKPSSFTSLPDINIITFNYIFFEMNLKHNKHTSTKNMTTLLYMYMSCWLFLYTNNNNYHIFFFPPLGISHALHLFYHERHTTHLYIYFYRISQRSL